MSYIPINYVFQQNNVNSKNIYAQIMIVIHPSLGRTVLFGDALLCPFLKLGRTQIVFFYILFGFLDCSALSFFVCQHKLLLRHF